MFTDGMTPDVLL